MSNIRFIGLDEVLRDFENAPHVIRKEGRRLLDELGQWGEGRAKAYTMDAGAVDLGELLRGIHHTTRVRGKTIETVIRPSDAADRYAVFVEKGTRPHFPPISAIQGWADRHGIPAWAVAKKIAREGTEPRHMWRDTFRDLQGQVNRDIKQFCNRLMRQL